VSESFSTASQENLRRVAYTTSQVRRASACKLRKPSPCEPFACHVQHLACHKTCLPGATTGLSSIVPIHLILTHLLKPISLRFLDEVVRKRIVRERCESSRDELKREGMLADT